MTKSKVRPKKINSPVPVCTFMWLARLKTGEAWERGRLAFSYLSRETNYIKPLSLLRRTKPERTSTHYLSRETRQTRVYMHPAAIYPETNQTL